MNAVTDLSSVFQMPRRDPVVYGAAVSDDGLLAETLERYRRDGYLCFDSFLGGADLAALKEEVATCPAVDVHRFSARVNLLARDPALLGPVRQILGGQVYVHRSRVRSAAGPDAEPFYWHSDFEGLHAEDGMPRMRAVTVEISLSDATPETGPLMLVPGSHVEYVPGQRPEPAALAALIERNGIFTVTGPAGSMVLFDCNLLHGSNGNITPRPRASLSLLYNSVDNRSVI